MGDLITAENLKKGMPDPANELRFGVKQLLKLEF